MLEEFLELEKNRLTLTVQDGLATSRVQASKRLFGVVESWERLPKDEKERPYSGEFGPSPFQIWYLQLLIL